MIQFLRPEPTTQQLQLKAASGLNGCIAAREELKRRKLAQLRKELGR